jgi:membrane protease subunit HflC
MKSPLVIVVLVVAIVAAWGSVYVVSEAEQVVVTQFGRPVGEPVTEPGLHLKLPLIQSVHAFDKRFLEWDGEANQLPTRDKRFIWVDTYARWRISDPLKFFQRLENERGAQTRLDDILDGETRDAIASHDLVEVVRSSNREPAVDESQTEDELVTLVPIEFGRDRIRQEILERSREGTEDLGIEILDVRLKRINYVAEVQANVFERMIAERERIAARFRSEGEGEALRIQGEKERALKRIESEAYRQAEEIRGRADAQATEVYARAYDRSAVTRSFYELIKSLETLEATVAESTELVLSSDGDLYRFLTDSQGRR